MAWSTLLSGQDQVRLRNKHLLHLPPYAYGAVSLVDHHICPAHQLARGDRLGDLPPVRQAERQGTGCERVCGRQKPTDHRVATLSVQDLAGLKVALGSSDRVSPEARRT